MADAKSGDGNVLGCIVLFFIVLGGGGWLYSSLFGEQEGEAKYEDCRNKITIQEGSADTLFKSFTCSYFKNDNGKTTGGICVHVVTEGPVCQTAYIYYKKPQ